MTIRHIVLSAAIVVSCPLCLGRDWVRVQQKEGECTLEDFADRPDGELHGYHTWFGDSFRVMCSFFVASGKGEDRLPRIVAEGGRVPYLNFGLPEHCRGGVAFFNAEQDLIACSATASTDEPEQVSDGPVQTIVEMPVPPGVHREVCRWRVVHYESNLAEMGKVSWTGKEPVQVTQTTHTGLDAKTEELSWPRWPSDGERGGAVVSLRDGVRQIPSAKKAGFRSETLEGELKLIRRPPGDFNLALDAPALHAGESLGCKVEYRIELDPENRIKPWSRIRNPTLNRQRVVVYMCLFDAYGNLVMADHACSFDMEPRSAIPSASSAVGVDERVTTHNSFSHGGRGHPIPRGMEEKVASYKITVYESEIKAPVPSGHQNTSVQGPDRANPEAEPGVGADSR